MNYRQVHLDFHTSEKIENIGAKFDKKEFQETLKTGFVNSITLFSKCHHGWSYHPTKANKIHPNLKFDLLGSQIEAAHEIGVKTPVYLSAGFDEKDAVVHKDWLVHSFNTEKPTFSQPGFHLLCFNSPYLERLLEQIKETAANYNCDGIFLDITAPRPCICDKCSADMVKLGLDPKKESDVWSFAEKVYMNYLKRVREAIDSVCPGMAVFHNSGHVKRGRRDLIELNSHLELESLPTGGWGYDHFPVSSSYARTLPYEFLGMTGKFHLSWGEFGGLKHPNALRYETALSVANGAKCSIGDQLHPSGKLDIATYDVIGKAYSEIKEKEPWLENAKNVADIAVLGTEALESYFVSKGIPETSFSIEIGKSDTGCARILLEGKYLFNYIDCQEDFSKYKLIILPDDIKLDKELSEKLKAFVKSGGKILATGNSGRLMDTDNFEFDFGCKFLGENPFNPDYFVPDFHIDCFLKTGFIMYSKGYKIELTGGKQLGHRENPYFNRTAEHFCSHIHTPSSGIDGGCAISVGKDGAYIAWKVFEDYATKGSLIIKKMVCQVIDEILNKSVETSLPAQGVVTLTKQNERQILHLLYASPVKRGENVEIIEDIIPLYNTFVKVAQDTPASKVYLAPQNKKIPFTQNDGYVEFIVPTIENHQMVVIE